MTYGLPFVRTLTTSASRPSGKLRQAASGTALSATAATMRPLAGETERVVSEHLAYRTHGGANRNCGFAQCHAKLRCMMNAGIKYSQAIVDERSPSVGPANRFLRLRIGPAPLHAQSRPLNVIAGNRAPRPQWRTPCATVCAPADREQHLEMAKTIVQPVAVCTIVNRLAKQRRTAPSSLFLRQHSGMFHAPAMPSQAPPVCAVQYRQCHCYCPLPRHRMLKASQNSAVKKSDADAKRLGIAGVASQFHAVVRISQLICLERGAAHVQIAAKTRTPLFSSS
jgi:hypothetical protein